MANPDYAALLAQIAAETDPVARQLLIDQAYQFIEELTDDEIELFEYTQFGYIDPNPGFADEEDFSPVPYFVPNYVVFGYVGDEESSDGQLYVVASYIDEGYFVEETIPTDEFIAFVGNYFNDEGANTGGPYDPSDYISQF